MDLSVILIAAVILIISLILVYFLLVRGYREPSFEEFKSNSHAMSLLLDNERGKAKDKKEKKKKTDRKDVGVSFSWNNINGVMSEEMLNDFVFFHSTLQMKSFFFKLHNYFEFSKLNLARCEIKMQD